MKLPFKVNELLCPGAAKSAVWTGRVVISIFLVLVSGCGGTKILDKPVPISIEKPLVVAADEHIRVDLDWIIVRDGPGTWARKADWDEYLVTVKNLSDRPMEITGASVYDSTGFRLRPSDDRKKLVKRSRESVRRYRDLGISVEAG